MSLHHQKTTVSTQSPVLINIHPNPNRKNNIIANIADIFWLYFFIVSSSFWFPLNTKKTPASKCDINFDCFSFAQTVNRLKQRKLLNQPNRWTLKFTRLHQALKMSCRRRKLQSSCNTHFKWTALFWICSHVRTSLIHFVWLKQFDDVLVLISARSEGLASFGIHFLSLKGYKLVDDSMSASVVLYDVQLDDIRPGREKFITK